MKESWDYNLDDREKVLHNSTVIKEIEVNKKETAESPYDLDMPYQHILPDFLIAGSKEAYDNFFDAISKKYFDVIYENNEALFDARPLPRKFFEETLVHVMSLENYEILQDDDYLGDNKKNGAVYLQTSHGIVLPNDDFFGKGKIFVRLIISTDALFQYQRKIYIDDESITETPEEYGKSFFMYGGIPKSSIQKVQVIKIGDLDIPDAENYEYDPGKDGQMEKEYDRRLASVKSRLEHIQENAL